MPLYGDIRIFREGAATEWGNCRWPYVTESRCRTGQRGAGITTGLGRTRELGSLRTRLDRVRRDTGTEITLREGPHKPDVVISLARVRYVSVANCADLHGFVDEISLVHLPKMPHPWPYEATGLVVRFGGLPELSWLRIIGPIEVNVVASLVTIYSAMSDDEASADRTV
ncbi:hypothetical protein [Streptomyces liangshanensis]|uniref:hypothetical protein n=1 Tax=Streptomyces liangshanensis TaxID=2717324 RepID=UPI0036D8C47A